MIVHDRSKWKVASAWGMTRPCNLWGRHQTSVVSHSCDTIGCGRRENLLWRSHCWSCGADPHKLRAEVLFSSLSGVKGLREWCKWEWIWQLCALSWLPCFFGETALVYVCMNWQRDIKEAIIKALWPLDKSLLVLSIPFTFPLGYKNGMYLPHQV